MRPENTLRELVAEIGDATFAYAATTEEAYEIAWVLLLWILKDGSQKGVNHSYSATKYSH